ncbi:PTS sugar transporter subunit IIB [Escherichia coli]
MLVKRMVTLLTLFHLKLIFPHWRLQRLKGKLKIDEVDVALLRTKSLQKPEIEAVAQGKMPVAVIEMKDYGTMNGQAVLEFAMKLLQE